MGKSRDGQGCCGLVLSTARGRAVDLLTVCCDTQPGVPRRTEWPSGDWQGCQWVPLEMPCLTLRSGYQGSSLESSAWGLSARNGGSVVKNPPATAGGARDLGLIPGSGSAGVQPRQDPGGTLRMNGVGERRHVRPALIGPSLRGRERKRQRERERNQMGVQQSLAMLYFLP